MIILVIINFFWLEWDYHTNGGFTEDYVKVNASEKENKYYEELHQYLDGKLNAEKVSYVSEEYQRYHNLVSGDYSTEYDSSMHTGYAFGDYSLLTVHFYNPIKYLITYKELNDGLLEKAEENIRFFSDKNNKYEVVHTATFRGQQGRISRTVWAILNGQPSRSAERTFVHSANQYSL